VSTDQLFVFGILGTALALFIWGRWRYDVVAMLALIAAVAVGVVPADEAFEGFADPAVVTVAAVLVLSAAIRSSGFLDFMLRPLAPMLRGADLQVFVLAALVAAFSAFMNNVGALAIFLPIALRIAQRTGRPPAALLMPLSFASLLGGLTTLIGTPPNLLISAIRHDILGKPFSMFDFAPVGIGLTLAGLLVVTFGWRLIPRNRRGQRTPADKFRIEDYTTEVRLPDGSPYVGRKVVDLENEGEGDITVAAVVREGYRRYVPHGHWTLLAGDILLLEGDPTIVKRVVDTAQLQLAGNDERPADPTGDGYGVVEAVITDTSPLVGGSPAELRLRHRYGKLQVGDVLVLQGPLGEMPETLNLLGCLPLAERNLEIGRPRRLLLPVGVMAAAVSLVVMGGLPVSVTFIGAILVLILIGTLHPRDVYGSVEWPVIVLLGALIPVSDALRTSGGTELIAVGLSSLVAPLPPLASLAIILVSTMLVTPILNNAATVLVMAPIGAGLAVKLGLNPDPFLMAVAVGASCDFLTPIGHQSNTLVMAPAGYRFSDYWRLGLPLSLIVLAIGVPLIAMAWPLN